MNPFEHHPLRRYDFAWQALHGCEGHHLDLGCGTGEFVGPLAAHTSRPCHGADPHGGYLRQLKRCWPSVSVQQVATSGPLAFVDAAFTSLSMLDVLEHVADEDATLAEVHRVLAPGGVLVITVPGRHLLSVLDPDNAKYRTPRLHRAVYSARFGADTYDRRFVDLSDGLRGDMSVGRDEHTNYRPEQLTAVVERNGFRIVDRDGANLFWRLAQVPGLFVGGRLRATLDRLILADGRRFSSANLFIEARRVP